MPNLRNVSFNYCDGVPWIAMSAVLSIPQLRDVSFNEGQIAHQWDMSFPEQLDLIVSPALASLKYTRKNYYRAENKYPEMPRNIKLLNHVARHASQTLEVVVLPSELAPYQAFQQQAWPRLRQLSLRGRRLAADEQGGLKPTSFLAQMPNLRVLKLELSQPRGMERCVLWPPGMDGTPPCTELETLCLSYPHPDDPIFAHLPHTLRHLALRCWPRHYMSLVWHDRKVLDALGWSSPILTSSEMLSIVRSCQSSPLTGLQHLDIEYEEDERCADLLRGIPSAFPNVTFLTIHRYRRRGVEGMPVVSGDIVCPMRSLTCFQIEIAKSLSSLTSLRVLRIHLDLKEAPHPFAYYKKDGRTMYLDFLAAIRSAAHTFSQTLPPSVQWVCILDRRGCENIWYPYRIVRDALGACSAARDLTVRELEGVP